MSKTYDVVIIGLGGMGSAAAAHLAARGQRVLGLDQFTPPHDRGSSHGLTRVIRQSYFEHPSYVPLLLRAYELWRELGPDQLTVTGGLMLGVPDGKIVTGCLRSARQFNLPHELLDAGQIRRRFPQFTPNDNEAAFYEANAGFVRPEAAVHAHLERAAKAGATLRFNEKVTDLTKLDAGQIVITAGPWVTEFVKLPVRIERQVQFWFEPAGDLGRMPVWVWELEDGRHPYGLPVLDGAGKAAFHDHSPALECQPDTTDRTVHDAEVETMRKCLRSRIPKLPGRLRDAKTCLYTTTADEHFIIDRISEKILVVSPCSGHGFKFCPVIGEIVADLVTTGHTRHDISLFRLR